jgi:flagella basal body P-ring formation protein FlgA
MVSAATTRETVLDTRAALTVNDPVVRLQDLVLHPDSLPESWRSRVVAPAPAPGAQQRHSLFVLARSLQHYEDMADVRLQGASSVTIERSGIALESGRIAAAVEAYVKSHERWAGRDLIVRCDPPAEPITTPTNARPPVVAAFEPTATPDRYRFDLAVDTGGPAALHVPVFAEVQLSTQVWVAARNMARGHVLSAGDLSTESVPAGEAARFMVTRTDAAGMELIRPLRAGQRLEAHCVAPLLCVRQGEMLDVAVQRGSLRILMHAKALASGRRDERIFCMNENSGSRLYVRLTGTREATADP